MPSDLSDAWFDGETRRSQCRCGLARYVVCAGGLAGRNLLMCGACDAGPVQAHWRLRVYGRGST